MQNTHIRFNHLVVQLLRMNQKSITAAALTRPGYLQALLDPLGSMSAWTSLTAAKTELELLAHNAIGTRNHSLWWNYIYLHERYVDMFSPGKNDCLPGFPDMDTAIKVGAPSVYNWYYERHKIAPTPWADVPFVDLCLAQHAGFLVHLDARELLRNELAHWTVGTAPDTQLQTYPPFWLLASAWSHTPEWGALLGALNTPLLQGKSIGISTLDRLVVPPSALWQWQCVGLKDIGFLSQEAALKALDGLRMGSLSDNMRSRCESHFLSYFPQCKPEAEIAFALGAPLWVPPMDSFESPLITDMFEVSHEALHPT